ncbi:helix-turn-helix domain-containing protein [Leclercia adecarboxylata]|uniref:helix-turn-helix domain-containing protein n=1 Tax=Leclercia adecarboxylata TaxID=83655 RepID=UPI0011184521|nr:helix-turn-helix domain-containing protein [Leclercia adecarboxylata]QCZ26689.1 Crp/Fnr family transcriptional regulator [Leclercia adecarboxylata]
MQFVFEKIHEHYRTLDLNKHQEDVIACAKTFSFNANEPLIIEPGSIYYVSEGVLSIAMDEDPRIIGTTIEFMPVGLLEWMCPVISFNYMTLTAVTILQISVDDFERIFYDTSKSYMKELTTILSYMLIVALDVHVERRTDSGYHTIKAMLRRYLYRRSVNTKENEGIANFIIRRTNLSRSYVFRVLAELKEGQYITVKKGKLISIDRTLPHDF